jgi:hypothetical protein
VRVASCLAMRWLLMMVLATGCEVVVVGPDASDAGPSMEDAAMVEVDGGTPEPDAGMPDAGMPDAGPRGRVIYPTDRRHSPITEDLAAGLRAVRERGPDLSEDVFAKVGASATQSTSFLHCFAGSNVELDGRDALQPTIDHFLGGDADGTTPFDRESVTAIAGWHAGRALRETDPPPIEIEVETILPGFAVVMYGTNDVGIVSDETYGRNMLDLADYLLDRGVVPIFTSIMPRDDSTEADARVPLFNTIVRGIAQARGFPFVDFHRELVSLPDHGLSSDDVHPSRYPMGACVFTEQGLAYGYNIRNLITIEALDRALAATEGVAAPDTGVDRIAGDGSPLAPFEIAALPFTDVRDTFFSAHRNLNEYTGCAAPQDESGPELLYRLELTRPTDVHAIVVSRAGVDVDVHLLDATASEAGCIERDHQELRAALDAGVYYLALDSFTSSDGEEAGEYLLVVQEE